MWRPKKKQRRRRRGARARPHTGSSRAGGPRGLGRGPHAPHAPVAVMRREAAPRAPAQRTHAAVCQRAHFKAVLDQVDSTSILFPAFRLVTSAVTWSAHRVCTRFACPPRTAIRVQSTSTVPSNQTASAVAGLQCLFNDAEGINTVGHVHAPGRVRSAWGSSSHDLSILSPRHASLYGRAGASVCAACSPALGRGLGPFRVGAANDSYLGLGTQRLPRRPPACRPSRLSLLSKAFCRPAG
jgi:hypothetical protein